MNENMLKQKRIIGFSLGIFLIIVELVAFAISFVLKKMNIITQNNINLVTYIINAISIYVIGYGILKVTLRNIETSPKKEKTKIRFSEILLLICITIGSGQIVNIITQIIISSFKMLFNIQINNNVTNLLQESNPLYMIIFAAILGPIMEELIFRKTLMEKLRIYGDKTAIIYTSIAFGLFHCNLAQIPYAIAVGCILGYAKVKTNSITVPILLHIIINSLSVILMIALKRTSWIAMILIMLFILTCVVLTLVFIPIKLSKKEVQIENESKYEKNGLYKNIGYIFSVIAIVIITIVSSIG